ncbi:MAG: hypothetical protein KJN64_11945 [Ignavibacteria bacterium]|nr:hypothetical protein [Ignavibacteria bacterium]MBT8383523.1 hypothetical protein [Ignavibacteria bacterium]MBT8391338.1 hypothetical protein [Ignavibacteria bacterium]NNJ52797.1 hypothetical protein [Ignavibacteriaceae bacterium]NNL20025.1 hypothetical protein [Ignavibacteriaceae bacterium]
MKNLIKLVFTMIFATFLLTACSDDPVSPEVQNISGKWDGIINHPGYDSGTISLNILENSNNLSGTFTMRLVKNNGVQNYSGTIAGAKTNDKTYSLSLIGSNFTWISSLDLNSSTLSGDWESTSRGNISGTLSVQKN